MKIKFLAQRSCALASVRQERMRSSLSESCARYGRTSARNRAHVMPDVFSVNLASVSIVSVRQRLSSAYDTIQFTNQFQMPRAITSSLIKLSCWEINVPLLYNWCSDLRLKLMTYGTSLRHEFLVSTGRR